MPTPEQKISESKKGEKNPNAKPICVFGKLYPTASDASNTLRKLYNTKQKGNFIANLTKSKKHQHDVFYVTKEFYEQYEYTNEYVTRDTYDEFLNL